MKKFLLLAVLSVFAIAFIAPVASAQIYVINKSITFPNLGTKFSNSASDSAAEISMINDGVAFPALKGAQPDSIRWVWYGKGPGTTTSIDSIAALFTLWARLDGNALVTKTLLDSIKANGNHFLLIPKVYWSSYRLITVQAAPSTAKNNAFNSGAFFEMQWQLFYHH